MNTMARLSNSQLKYLGLAVVALLPCGLVAQNPVGYDRLVNAAKEPQNYLTYAAIFTAAATVS